MRPAGEQAGQGACDWPETGIYIGYQGCVMPCCMVGTPDRVNFGRTKGYDIARIWNGRACTDFRLRLDPATHRKYASPAQFTAVPSRRQPGPGCTLS